MEHYAKRKHMELGKYYTDHIMAMTAEQLHEKSDIAGELAYRDEKIAALQADIRELANAYEKIVEARGYTTAESDRLIVALGRHRNK